MSDALREMEVGECLVALADKASVPRDLEAFARSTGNGFLGSLRCEDGWQVTLERRASSRLQLRPAAHAAKT